MLWAESKSKGLKFFYFFIFGGNSVAISRALLTIEHGDEVTVNVLKCKRGCHTRRYDKDVSRTGVRLESPHMVKFQTDSCLEWGSMIINYERPKTDSCLIEQNWSHPDSKVRLCLCLSHGLLYLPVDIKHASSRPSASNPCIGLVLCAIAPPVQAAQQREKLRCCTTTLCKYCMKKSRLVQQVKADCKRIQASGRATVYIALNFLEEFFFQKGNEKGEFS